MDSREALDQALMRRALELAQRGIGFVEPNPAVGAIVADEHGKILGEGWHQRFGGPHAEVHALAAAGEAARGATLYVTLEPCCHFGKTPPCSRAVIAAGIRRVIIGIADPARHGAGSGIEELKDAGIAVEVGVLEDQARQLIAPFALLNENGRPWIHAKWAMTLDGKVATRTGSSQWISNTSSRALVHQLRGRMDAILTGIGTVEADDPLLTARPAGPRIATRIVLDSTCRLREDSKLVQSVADAPVLVITTSTAMSDRIDAIRKRGAEVLVLGSNSDGRPDLTALVRELGRRRMTNILLEAGTTIHGSFFDAGLIDEVHAFVAPILAGGQNATTPVAGQGVELMSQSLRLKQSHIQNLDGDVYVHGFVARAKS